MKCPVIGADARGAVGIEVAAGAIAGAPMVVAGKAPAGVMPVEALACLAGVAVIMRLEINVAVGESLSL